MIRIQDQNETPCACAICTDIPLDKHLFGDKEAWLGVLLIGCAVTGGALLRAALRGGWLASSWAMRLFRPWYTVRLWPGLPWHE